MRGPLESAHRAIEHKQNRLLRPDLVFQELRRSGEMHSKTSYYARALYESETSGFTRLHVKMKRPPNLTH